MTDPQALSELKKDVALSQRLQDLLRQVLTAEASKARNATRGIFDVAALNRQLGKAEGIEDLLKLTMESR
jgi:hypothetical protein